jgi:hypothetical protein
MREAGRRAGLFVCGIFASRRFIAHSPNKIDGTRDRGEHRPSPVVVGAGNADM